MRNILCLLLIGICLVLAVNCAMAEYTYVEVTKAASIRSEASYSGNRIRLAEVGEQFECVGSQGSWYKVSLSGGTIGYLPQDSCVLRTLPGGSSDTQHADSSARITRINIQDRNVTIAPRTRWALAFTLNPGNAARSNIVWTSSNQSVATVDGYGVVTGVSRGSARITATAANNSSATASITIKVEEFDLVFTTNETKTATYEYGTGQFTVRARARTGCVSVPSVITQMWAVVMGGYATDTFDVTPVRAGTDVITVTAGSVKTTITVYVSPEVFTPIETPEETEQMPNDQDGSTQTVEPMIPPIGVNSIGSIVSYGHYPQAVNGTDNSPIEWIILDLDVNSHRALLISKYALTCQPYHSEYTNVTWENCALRSWLNSSFLNTAFSTSEQRAILTTTVDNSSSNGYGAYDTYGGNNTQDKIFLLSYQEAWHYFDSNDARKCAPTNYAISQGALTDSSSKVGLRSAGPWWLRSPGCNLHFAIGVRAGGDWHDFNISSYDNIGIRPAFWLNLASIAPSIENEPNNMETTVTPTIMITAPEHAALGEAIEITAAVSNASGSISYQWQTSSNGETSWNRSALPGKDTATLTFEATESRLSRYYRCAVTDDNGTWYSEVVHVELAGN